MRTLFKNKLIKIEGFTLLETLTAIGILALVIIGPLSVIINSSSYARQTKDTIVATYMAEEAIELIQNQYNSLDVLCKKSPSSAPCASFSSSLSSGKIAWLAFKERFGVHDGQPSCYVTDNPEGCSYDFLHMIGDITTTPVRYISTDSHCRYMVEVKTSLEDETTRNSYVCQGEVSHITGTVDTRLYTRSVSIEWLPTFESGAIEDQYNDDLRITVTVGFKGVNGYPHSISITKFMHSQP